MAAGPTFPGPKPCPLDHAPVTHDPVDVAEIGYELAAARALLELTPTEPREPVRHLGT
jgi:hypothetical protein